MEIKTSDGTHEIKVISVKKGKALKVINPDNQTARLFVNGKAFKTVRNIENIYSYDGLTIHSYNVKVIGNSNSTTVRIWNTSNNMITFLTYPLIKSRIWVNNSNYPNYLKNVLNTIYEKLPDIKATVDKKPLTIKPKIAQSVTCVMCSLTKQLVPISNCEMCSYCVMVKDNKVICSLS